MGPVQDRPVGRRNGCRYRTSTWVAGLGTVLRDRYTMRSRMSVDPPFFFIVNPKSGQGSRRFADTAARLRGRAIRFSAAATTGPGDARVLASMLRNDPVRAIVCVGGDGTINE